MRKAQKEQAEGFIKLLEQAHEEIKVNIEKGNLQPVLVTLADCQDGAIAMGNLIEASEGEGFVTISYLEKYCEAVFQIHESILAGDSVDANKIVKKLKKGLIQIENSVRNDIKVRKEVVFFPYKASMWDSLESVYLAAKEDPDCDAYCVPIPYFDRNADGSLGQMHYEGNEYPENIEVIDWRSYKLEERRPDVIYIHNPYDACNRVTCVHPIFFSTNLKKYTEKLVYIPYFVLQEVEPDDQNTIDKMKLFCFLPGVINADKVIVQSEKMRQIYINEYEKAARANGIDTDRKQLEEKFLGTGSPKFDKVLNTRKEDLEIPKEWLKIIQKPDGSFKKIIFYNTSISALLRHEEQMLVKMKSVFKIFKENQAEVALLWRPHPLIPTTIKSMRPQLWEAYRKIVEEYKAEGWGIYDDTADMDRAVVLSDAYYGDVSSIVPLYQKTGKPVMIQDVKVLNTVSDKNFERNKINVTIEDVVLFDDTLWFCAQNYNSLYTMNINTKEVNFVGEFPNEAYGNSRLFASMKLVGKKIYFIPFYAKEIVVYDIEGGNFFCIKLSDAVLGKKCGDILFMGVEQYKNYLYILPVYATIIIRLDTTNNCVDYITDWYDKSKNMIFNCHDFFFRKQSVIQENKLYVPFCNANAVLEVNCDTMQTLVYRLGEEKRGYTGICYDRKQFWLAPRRTRCLLKWDNEANIVEQFDLFEDTKKHLTFVGILHDNSKILAFPAQTENSELIQREEVIVMEDKFSFAKEENNTLMYYEMNSCALTIINQDNYKKTVEIAVNLSQVNLERMICEVEKPRIEQSTFGIEQFLYILEKKYDQVCCI